MKLHLVGVYCARCGESEDIDVTIYLREEQVYMLEIEIPERIETITGEVRVEVCGFCEALERQGPNGRLSSPS